MDFTDKLVLEQQRHSQTEIKRSHLEMKRGYYKIQLIK